MHATYGFAGDGPPFIGKPFDPGVQNLMPRPQAAFIVIGVVIIACIVAVVAVYICFLGSLPFSRNDPAGWGQFGDYIGGLLNPLFALMNVVIVAYIAISVQRLNETEKRREAQSEERVKTVVELHREWNSESLYRSRTLAGKLVRSYPKSTMLEIEETAESEDVVHVWIVVGFFLRLGFLVQHDKVHREMAIELFGELFVWWWIVSFERQLAPIDWDARERIISLKDWFYSHTTEDRREPWVRRAERDLHAAEAQSQSSPLLVL